MGNIYSDSEGKRLLEEEPRTYRPPEERAKRRYLKKDPPFMTTFESTINKYDYLLVFPNTELSQTDSTVKWGDVVSIWTKAVPGADLKKKQAVVELSNFWKKRTGSDPKDTDKIKRSAWLTVARETIIEHLSGKCSLQTKVTAHGSIICCRIRAPLKLLELQADKENYPLQLRGEIDPGEEFWNKVDEKGETIELNEEQDILSLEDAKLILEKLYNNNKISPVDLIIDPVEESQSSFTRRVHALERIADKVPVTNKYIAHSSFPSTKPHLRYLFQMHPSIRGPTLFRVRDKLALTKSIIDQHFDMQVLENFDIIESFLALHDASRGEALTVDSLSAIWLNFWWARASDVGSPLVTHDAYEDDVELWFFLRPFAQPLKKIREYFGEKVALYFVWFGFYTYFLIVPALLGVAAMVLFYVRGYMTTTDNLDYPMYVYGLLMVTWAKVYEIEWKRECAVIALKWGTRGFESEELDRPQFTGDPSKPIERSLINNRNITHYPDSKRSWTKLQNSLLIALMIFLDLGAIYAVLYAQYVLGFTTEMYLWIISAVLALLIPVSQSLYGLVAITLNDWENYRTDTDYEDSLVIKTIAFSLFNDFGAAVFTAYGKQTTFGTCLSTCLTDLRILLFAIVIVHAFIMVAQLVAVRLKGFYRNVTADDGTSGGDLDDVPSGTNAYSFKNQLINKEELQRLTSPEKELGDDALFLKELRMEEYEGTFEDFAFAYRQFGYINLFAAIFPMMSLVFLAENLFKIRLDAYKLCRLCRRPHVELAEDAGYWAENMGLIVYLGVFMKVGLFIFTEGEVDYLSTTTKVIAFLVICNALVLYVKLIEILVPVENDFVTDIAARQEFVVDKYVKGFEDNDGALDISKFKGNLENRIDADAFNIYDMNKGLKLGDEDFTRIEEIEKRRNALLREQKLTKDRLQEMSKIEKFNENTGVGETKHGLPLGRLTVRLVEIQKFEDEELKSLGARPELKVRISFKGTKAGASAPVPSFGNLTDTHKLSLMPNGTVPINQSLGPFAPIRTIDADVIFDVLNMAPLANEASVATTTIKLRDLQDQAQQNKILPLQIRQVDGSLKPSVAKLYVNLTFQFSKIVPIRKKLYAIQDQLQTLEKNLTRLRMGMKEEK